MTIHLVVASDEQEGVEWYIGPFHTKQDAQAWAADDADEKLKQFKAMGTPSASIDGDGDAYLSITEYNAGIGQDTLYSWTIDELIPHGR